MELSLLRVVLTTIFDENQKPTGWRYHSSTKHTTLLRECALTRAYTAFRNTPDALELLVQAQFVDESGYHVPTTKKAFPAIASFLRAHPQLHLLAASQHMTEVGKVLLCSRDVPETLMALFGAEFVSRLNTHKWLKLAQIACQPGRVLGGDTIGGIAEPPIGDYVANVYIDQKRPQEDGVIYVDPEYWQEILTAYSTPTHVLPPGTSLVKVNSLAPDLTIKGVLMRASPHTWAMIQARTGRDDFQILLCGHAIKDNGGFEVGQVYEMDQSRFAYHADSSMHRGFRVNVSKQLLQRSGMDTAWFTEQTITPVIKRVGGLMSFDEKHVLAAIGAFSSKDGEETTLEHAAAIKRRIMQHGLPANHPVNVLQIWRLAMTVIRERLARIEVSGFHGMGAPFDGPVGYVGVPFSVYRRWKRQHDTDSAYLFRMPYLGPYCGRMVKLVPVHTDTILVHWQDALTMEGDFDGDQYFVVPSYLVSHPDEPVKPPRPGKGEKLAVPLANAAVGEAVIELATNKQGIGPRDFLLGVAYDHYHLAKHQGDRKGQRLWAKNIAALQVWVQQAVEGLKHSADGMLSDEAVKAMFGKNTSPHPYTSLMSNRSFRSFALQSTRVTPGYIETVKATVHPDYAYHPYHQIFTGLATLAFGEVASVQPYWEAVRGQRARSLAPGSISPLFRQIRGLLMQYASGIKRWNGGRNRNVTFGADILQPIRAKWQALCAPLATDPQKVHDLHVLLAKVAYEPQPNWELIGTKPGRLGLFVRIARGLVKPRLFPVNRIARMRVIYQDHKPLLDGRVTVERGKYRMVYRRWLPRSGSLFHHLATPELARTILREALPAMDFQTLDAMLLQGALEAFEPAIET